MAEEPARPLRILLADDHGVVREGLASILNRRTTEFLVVAEAEDGEEALALWSETRPDVSVLDLRMPRRDGVETIKAIRGLDPTAKLIILTTYDTDEDIYQGLRAGAMGYLLKDAERADILEAIRTVARGETYLPPIVATRLAARDQSAPLTTKERQVLECLSSGLSNKQIAHRLAMGEGTVKTHVRTIFAKLGVASRTEAVRVAAQHGLVKLTSH